jgi:omega-amidase
MSSTTNSNSDKLRVALCQFHVTPDKEMNHATAADYIDRAAAEGAVLVVLPEIWNSPYATSAFKEYAEVLPQVGDTEAKSSPSSALLMERAKQHQVWIVGGSIPEVEADGNVYNTCLVYSPTGTVVAKHRKVHLFDISVPGGITFRESDTLSPGNSLTSFSLRDDLDVGIGICYDIRFPLQAMLMCQSKPNCKLLIFPGAFNMTTGPAHWELLQRARALDNQCFVVTASPARTPAPEQEGKYPHYTAWGHSTCVDPWGAVVAKADEKEALILCDLEISRVDEVRTSIPIRNQKRTDLYKLEEVSTS